MVISRRQIYYIPYRSATTQNLRDLDFDLTRPLKVKFDSYIGLSIYGFLLRFNSVGPNYALLQDIRRQNMGDLDFDL